MPLLRTSPLLVAAVMLGASTCSKPDPGESKPAASVVDVQLKGVDTSPLTPRERHEWAAQVSELLAPCADTPVSIAQCVKESRACKACLPAAQFLLKQVRAGRPKKDREEAFHARFDAGKTKTIVTDGSPEVGSPDGVVTIVEWADFECPFCRAVYPLLDDLAHTYPSQVRVVFKFYPLQSHPHGEIAARAAVAALNQGKFWEMHHLLFENQQALEQQDLEKYAKQAGLDLAKFRADIGSKETGERIEKDKKQAEELGLDGTPFIFINGRSVNLQLLGNPIDDLTDWVKLDIELAGQTPKAVKGKEKDEKGAVPASTSSAVAPPSPAPSGSAVAPKK
ncbi:Periplasmic thiol:disulfide interchange protein DsbA [Minicystis rosea]|nr:Periplasmic thiol:disulfide interchange protein DsbA [Minicystis rosea]